MIERDFDLSVKRQCELLQIHRSGIYYKPTLESEENLTILRFLDEQYLKTPFYGIRKLQKLLSKKGYTIQRAFFKKLTGEGNVFR